MKLKAKQYKTVENLESTRRWLNSLSRKHLLITIFISQCQGFNARHHAVRQALRQAGVCECVCMAMVESVS